MDPCPDLMDQDLDFTHPTAIFNKQFNTPDY
jgi:hypothetical protein